ncbi:MAG: hypothetical protein DI539_22475 [Flavobacterium psychrophilum]|nr:MAG: hypothetical protein DI539_22475 [Flavobacterium psychrophilum]
MLYEYYLQAHLNQDFQEVSTESVLAIFKDYITAREASYIDLEFEEGNSCTIYMDTTNLMTTGFVISRPCYSRRFGECLYEVMLLGNFVFFEPDGKAPIIISPAAEEHLPIDMVESLGKPAIGKSKESFLELYSNNRKKRGTVFEPVND